jgi:DNA polymerase I-like protein with 3'-5' exonuclease and polymerase domains
MLAAGCLYCEFPKNLGFLTSIYTDLPYFKDEGKEFDPARIKKDQFYLYNAKDSLACHQIYTKQKVELLEQGVDEVYKKTISILPLYKQMEENGIRIDQEERERLHAKYSSLFRIHNLKLNSLASREYNPLSSLAMDNLIFKELKYKTLRGANDTSEDSLMLLRLLSEATAAPSTGPLIIDEIIACRKLHKVIEILELPQYPDHRFRCEFKIGGAETGRTTGGKSLDELLTLTDKGKTGILRLGYSLQTIGKHGFSIDGMTYGRDIRSMFVPSRGYRFVENDLSQAEARVDAVLAGNFNILAIFDGPIGIHRLTGSWAYGCPPEEVKKNVLVDGIDRYHVAKQVRHSGERNITAEGLVTKFLWGLSLSEGKRLLDVFHKYQPEIREVFHRDIIRSIDSTHSLIAPNGRRRDFFDRVTRSTYNEGFSFLPQAIVSDQTKFSLLETMDRFPEARLLTEAHDGVLAEVPVERVMEYIEIYKTSIEKPIDFRKGSLPRDYSLVIPCEASAGDNWNDLVEIKL